MNRNYVFPNINHALPALSADVLDLGDEVGSRNGRAQELTHVGITLTHPLQRGIALRGRNANIAAQVAETVWVLAGRNDIEWLAHYLPRAWGFSDDGETWRGGYGPRLRGWPGEGGFHDQLSAVVRLLRDDPLTRRAVISLWDPARDNGPHKDVPCNDLLVFTNRKGYLDMHVSVRSNDLMWGWSGINAFEWSALLEVVATMVGVDVGRLHFSVASLHLYQPHWRRARQVANTRPLPNVAAAPRFDLPEGEDDIAGLDAMLQQWFSIERCIRKYGASLHDYPSVQQDVDRFPEPMLRSWLQVLQWWWSGDRAYLEPLHGTDLHAAALAGLQPPARQQAAPSVVQPSTGPACSPFAKAATALHTSKDAAYGDSWKRRGEAVGILANIARKVDRMAAATATADETTADTATDLMIYLAKYATWLSDPDVQGPAAANRLIMSIDATARPVPPAGGSEQARLEKALVMGFDALERAYHDGDASRDQLVGELMADAYLLARLLWEHENEYRGADHA